MKYLMVKKEYDGFPRYILKNGRIIKNYEFVGGELFTEKQIEKFYKVDYKMFDEVEVSKRKIYYFFGCRFPLYLVRDNL